MTKSMQIAFFGASLVSAFRNGAATYYRGILRALATRGHRIRFYEPIARDRLEYRDILDPPWVQVIPFPDDGEGVEAAIEHAANADLLIKSSYVGAYDELLDRVIPQAAAQHALSVYWDMDPGVTLERLKAAPRDGLAVQLPWYDMALLRSGRERVMETYQRLGVPVCFPVYNAVDPAVHHPVDVDAERSVRLAFLGHRLPALQERVQKLFVNVAEQLPQHHFTLAGPDWDELSLPNNLHHIDYVYTGEHNILNCSAMAVLNVTGEHNIRVGHAPSARLFEAAGAGACVITDVWEGIETFFEPEREVLLAEETDDVKAHVVALNRSRASIIGKRAHARCLAEHTYAHRAADLEALLEGVDRRRPVTITR